MKALILAAGIGHRLGDITKNLPKPMIIIDGKPILQHNIELCKEAGIKDILINIHYLPEKIIEYFGDGSNFSVNISYNYEEKLLGTAGALKAFKKKIGMDSFFVLYGDNYSKFKILELKKFNSLKNGDVSILYHWREDVSGSGISEFNKEDRVLKFIEKPKKNLSKSDWVNAGIYYFKNKNIFDCINKYDDFAKDLFPKLINNKYKIFGYKDAIQLLSFDTPLLYKRNKIK